MKDILFVLVFSVVLLFFSIYPAIKIVEFFDKKDKLSNFHFNVYTVIITILISLSGGLFLRYF
ncbi:MAG: hypothetical protein GXP61_06695 [Epsilonproteobacteria bacterium]|nr:hypothetical protein [Campylobacterota bacterium]